MKGEGRPLGTLDTRALILSHLSLGFPAAMAGRPPWQLTFAMIKYNIPPQAPTAWPGNWNPEPMRQESK